MSTIGGPRLSTIIPTFLNEYSMVFNGVDDYVDTGITNTGTNDVSISCWIKTTETFVYTDKRCAFGGYNNGSGANYTLGILGSSFATPNDMQVRVFNTLGTTKLNDGNWHNIIYTHDYTTKETKAYVDGNTTPEVTTTIAAWSTNFKITIGWNGVNIIYSFQGNIDECAYWDSIISTSDITSIYNLGMPNDITSLNPIGWWRMGDNSLYKSPQWLLPSNENKDKVSNYSMSFDGSNDYMSTSVSSLNSTTEFTISFWGKKTSTTKTVGLNDRVADTNKFLLYWWSNGTVYLGARNGSSNSSATFALSYDSDWHHFMGVYVGGTSLRLYVDGVLRDTITSSVPATLSSVMGNNITIGYVNDTSYTTGNIDEVSIWDSDQSANISTISSNPLNDLTSLNPIAYYKMGENGTYKDPQWLIPSNENKDKVSNYSMSFDGTDDYVDCGTSIGDSLGDNYTGDLSVSLWFKTNIVAGPPANDGLFSIGLFNGAAVGMITISIYNNGLHYRLNNGGWIKTVAFTDTTSWHHLLVVYKVGSEAGSKMFLDGADVGTPSGTFPTTLNMDFAGLKTTIGAYYSQAFGTNGNIDEVAVWDSAISIGDVWDGSGKPIDINGVSGITNNWRMGDGATFDGTNWTVPDIVGSATGTSANMDINDRVGDAPGSTGNTLSYNMDINDRVGDAPNSKNNALSYNMVLSGRTTDVPT